MTLEADTFLDFAKESIEENGGTVTLRKTGTESYDTTTGELTSPTSDYATKGLIEGYSEYFVAQGFVQAGDRKITIAASSITVVPEQGDALLIGSEEFDIINVKSEFAWDIPVIYILQVRN